MALKKASNKSAATDTSDSGGGTKTYYFKGEAKWMHLERPDIRFEPKFSVSLLADKKTLDLYNKTGIRAAPRDDEDGTLITFTKKVDDPYVEGPPIVVDMDGVVMGSADVGKVGRGSVVIARVDVYPLKRIEGVGHRLVSVKVVDMVEYEGGAEVAGGEEYAF